VTTPTAGLPGAVTRAVMPQGKTAPVVAVPTTRVITPPVLPGEGKEVLKQCSCLAKNIITAVLAVIFTVLVIFLYQRFLGKKKW